MLKRLTIENFRCLRLFSIDFSDMNSCAILGRNGSGKTTIGAVIEILQKIAHQTSRVGDLVKQRDISEDSRGPIVFKVEATVHGKKYIYRVSFELPERFRELRVAQEDLIVEEELIFSRTLAQVSLRRSIDGNLTNFGIDWHVIALPIIQAISASDPISIFKNWLSSILVLRPIPSLMCGESDRDARLPKITAENFGEWFTGTIASNPASYEPFMSFLRDVFPDISSVKNLNIGTNSRSIVIEFLSEENSIAVRFEQLSDGEKCFFVCGLVIAMASEGKPFTCFWDEPDNYLAPQEVSSVILSLRRAFSDQRQLIITSHNHDAIRSFSDENTIVLSRDSHLTSPKVRTLENLADETKTGRHALELWLKGDLGV